MRRSITTATMASYRKNLVILIAVIPILFSMRSHGQNMQSIIATVDPDCANIVKYELLDPESDAKSPRWEISGAGTLSSETGMITYVTWESSGVVTVKFFVGQMEDAELEKTFTYTPPTSGGTIVEPVPSTVCNGASGTLTVTGVSPGAVWQSCTSGCSTTDDEGWTNISSGDYSNLTVTTSYRVKANSVCGSAYSNIVTITVNSVTTPVITTSSTVFNVRVEEYTFTTQSGMSNYQWTVPGGDITAGQGTKSIKVRWDEGGPKSLRVSFAGAGGCTAESENFPVTVLVNNYNWIKESIVLIENQSEATLNGLEISSGQKSINWIYFDGLGRPMQSISVEGSPLQKDLVKPITYDEFGRESKKWLPYVHQENNGYYKIDAIRSLTQGSEEQKYLESPQYNFYQQGGQIASDLHPYAKSNFEPSPLNRIFEQGAAGTVWQPNESDSYASPTDRTVKKAYEMNGESEVLLWSYSYPNLQSGELFGTIDATFETGRHYYAANSLFKNKTKDENGHEVIEYTDKLGRTILKRVQAVSGTQAVNNTTYASTYYLYDDFGSLVSVLPPEASNRLESEYFAASSVVREQFLTQWAFRYTYDERRRMIIKQVPGAEPMYMVYDDRDRLVLTQDGNQRLNMQWNFTKYDQLDRPVITGIYTHNEPESQQSMRAEVSTVNFFEKYDGDELPHGYTSNVFPTVNTTILTVTYYDNYSFRDELFGAGYNFKHDDIVCNLSDSRVDNDNCQETSEFLRVHGQVTGTKTNILNSSEYLLNVVYYDDKYRVIQNVSKNQFGQIERTTMVLDFAGKVLKTKTTTGNSSAAEFFVTRRFNYDHAGRLEQTFHKIDRENEQGNEVLLSEQVYNELGQLVTKKLYNSKLPVTPDPAVGQPGVNYGTDLILETFDPQVTTYVASNSITIKPGFTVPSGGSLTVRLGYSQQDADDHNAAQAFAQEVNYRYNIRGWLTRINDSELSNIDGGPKDYFGMELAYNESIGITADPEFNGNISAVKWSTNLGLGTSDGLEVPEPTARGYAFTYDALNRLKTSGHFEKTTAWNSATAFHENIGTYDLNGNIKALNRTGQGGNTMDILDYTYTGNQLMKVADNGNDTEGFKDGNVTGDDYLYDKNGNMTVDKNKDIASIEYNHLNLPSKVTKNNGEYLKYVYTATGAKLSQVVYNASDVQQKKSDYLGEFFYENDTLRFINHEEGRVVIAEIEEEYQYTLKDHLGNIRITFTTKEEVDNLPATMDTGNESAEQERFGAYNSFTNQALDPTPAESAGDKILILNGSTLPGGSNGQVGLTRSFAVVPGDVVTASVNAKYETGSGQGNLAGFAVALTQAFLLTPGPEPMEGITPFEALNAFGTAIASGGRDGDENLPQGFLNILVFDKDYNLVDAAFKQVGTSTALIDTLEIRQPGFVYVFLSNDGATQQQIGFDNYSIDRTHSPVIQGQDYYPFGLTFNSYQRENSFQNHYKFQGQEHIDDLNLGWDSFKWRNYMPDIGRFFNIDPLADKYVYNSTYAFSENHVTAHVELEGLEKISIHSASFAPFNAFAGVFKGDGSRRKFGTNPNSSSRISGSVKLNLSGDGITQIGPPRPRGAFSTNVYTGKTSYSEAKMTSTLEGKSANGTTAVADFSFHLSGGNSLVPASPEIDVKGKMQIGVIDLGKNGSFVVFSGSVKGDKFPANETYVRDQNGTGVFLGVSGADVGSFGTPDTGPVTQLPGDNDRQMSEFNIGIKFNEEGNIENIHFDGQTYSPEEWASQFNLKPQKGAVATSNK